MKMRYRKMFYALAMLVGIFSLVYRPINAEAQCDLVRAKGKSKLKMAFGRAYEPCGGGIMFPAPNSVTEGGVPACTPATPIDSQWHFDSNATKTKLLLKPTKEGDYAVALKIAGMLGDDDATPAEGTGSLVLMMQFSMNDPVGGHMTTIPIPIETPVPMTGGKASVKTTVVAMMTALGLGDISNSECWVANVQSAHLEDPAGGLTGDAQPMFSEKSCCTFATKG